MSRGELIAYSYGRALRGASGASGRTWTTVGPGGALAMNDEERECRDRMGPEWDKWVNRGRWDGPQAWEGTWRI